MTQPTERASDLDPLLREAIAKVVVLTSGEATTADADEIKLWRAQSPDHEAAFRSAVKLWKQFGEVAAAQSPKPLKRDRIARRVFIGGALAATVAGYCVVRPPLELWPSWSELRADFRTGKGEQREVALSEATTVQLGTFTSLAVRPASKGGEPDVRLISGEAAFTTRDSKGQPLVVQAEGLRVIASDASFNARCIDGVVAVTCISGDVSVEEDGQTVLLVAGQQVSSRNGALGTVAAVDVGKATSWRTGMLIFQDKPLSEVIDEVNRYRPGRIVIANDELSHRVVNGTFRGDQIDTFIAQIQRLFGAKVTNLPAGLLVLS
ncbi:FecR domain-containing protein [Hyphomicrobium sp. NDB2Meth4]|uniref:FecR family protein n=1 Tax=Hyphomicrobium sp. NDB2Meth4 TaxID=1892846 RepID=UPI0009FAA7F1|nr:FecR domain-containing protein [Hyphomicrobium sp. NDB2Meth4]